MSLWNAERLDIIAILSVKLRTRHLLLFEDASSYESYHIFGCQGLNWKYSTNKRSGENFISCYCGIQCWHITVSHLQTAVPQDSKTKPVIAWHIIYDLVVDSCVHAPDFDCRVALTEIRVLALCILYPCIGGKILKISESWHLKRSSFSHHVLSAGIQIKVFPLEGVQPLLKHI